MSIQPFQFAGATAVVTGAAGGMGEHLARGLAERGSTLLIVDRNADFYQFVADDVAARRRIEDQVRAAS